MLVKITTNFDNNQHPVRFQISLQKEKPLWEYLSAGWHVGGMGRSGAGGVLVFFNHSCRNKIEWWNIYTTTRHGGPGGPHDACGVDARLFAVSELPRRGVRGVSVSRGQIVVCFEIEKYLSAAITVDVRRGVFERGSEMRGTSGRTLEVF